MEAVVGIFKTPAEADQAVSYLRAAGIPENHLCVLVPGATEKEIQSEVQSVPTTETEAPGVGAALGGVVGGAIGAAGGMSLGAAAATLLVPGVGPVIAIGLLGAAILGVGGAAGGIAVGEALDEGLLEGLPKDDLFIYEDALRHGRSVVISFTIPGRQASAARKVLEQAGAESIDTARKDWWLGLRDVEQEHYSASGRDFTKDEAHFRSGFEAAMHRDTRGKNYNDAHSHLSTIHPDICDKEAFREGYERGQGHHRKTLKSRQQSAN